MKVSRLNMSQISELLSSIQGWKLVKEQRIEKEFTFKDFASALAFVNRVSEVAESKKHHPDLYLAWGKVKIVLWTHSIDGLSEADFIVASKADALYHL